MSRADKLVKVTAQRDKLAATLRNVRINLEIPGSDRYCSEEIRKALAELEKE